MKIVRPVEESDLDQIYALSAKTKAGLTTLPHDRAFLKERIKVSAHNFKHLPKKPGGEVFMFVLEDTASTRILGTSALFSKVGGFEPFWTYALKSKVNQSDALGVSKRIEYLELKKIHNGPSEIGTLFLEPESREGWNGRMLSLGRFMFMAQYPQCFEARILAELRGVIDERGKNVFWEAVGTHFFEVPFEKADLMVNKDKSFIADLMPKHPIYVPLLPEQAQEVIGQVHPETAPARALLEQEGFSFQNEIDIFEAGPVLGCETAKIRTIQERQPGVIESFQEMKKEKDRLPYLVSRVGEARRFRLAVADVEPLSDGKVLIDTSLKNSLNVQVGDFVFYSPIKGKHSKDESNRNSSSREKSDIPVTQSSQS